jgi:branched-chain amino acid transport system ATP-binding protein
MLELSGVNSYYGLSRILQDLSLSVGEGETVALLGRNGAGKTTTLHSIMGVVKPRAGSIRFNGGEILGLRPSEILLKGIGLVPGNRGIFPTLTVLENLKMGHLASRKKGVPWGFEEFTDFVFGLFPRLKERLKNPGKKLSGGEQQMLAIARALGSKPAFLMIDEPTEGVSPEYVERIREILAELRQHGVAILLVENNIKMALSVSQRVYFIEKGIIRYEGSAEEVRSRPEIRLRYLGV